MRKGIGVIIPLDKPIEDLLLRRLRKKFPKLKDIKCDGAFQYNGKMMLFMTKRESELLHFIFFCIG